MKNHATRPRTYDYAQFTLSNGASDKDIRADIAALFSNIQVATRFSIKTNKNITVKLNSTAATAFPIDIGDSPFQFPPDFFDVVNIYLSNDTGLDATIRIWLFG